VIGTSVNHTRSVSPRSAPLFFSVYEKTGEHNPTDPSADQMAGGHGIEITPAEDHLAGNFYPTLFIAKNEYDKIRWVVSLQNLRTKFLASLSV